MRVRGGIYVLIMAILATGSVGAQAPKVYGAASPQEVVAGLQKAVPSGDYGTAFALISPAGRQELAAEAITGVGMMIAFSDPDDPMPGGKPLPKAELDAKRKNYRAAIDLAKQTLKPYGLDTIIGKPSLAPETVKAVDTSLAKADTVVLLTSLMSAMEKMGPMMGMKKSSKPLFPFEVGTVADYKISGDKATAKGAKETLEFVRIDGRWYVSPPASKGGK
jgi:hypothetical protein